MISYKFLINKIDKKNQINKSDKKDRKRGLDYGRKDKWKFRFAYSE